VRRYPPHHLSPAAQTTRQGLIPKRASAAPSQHSNAPIQRESQSILSNIVARRTGQFKMINGERVPVLEKIE
jgi:hypothetical protein